MPGKTRQVEVAKQDYRVIDFGDVSKPFNTGAMLIVDRWVRARLDINAANINRLFW